MNDQLFMDMSELFSMGLTVPVLIATAVVTYLYGRSVIQSKKEPKDFGGPEWLSMGIAVGFVGSFLDNGYWAIPWTLMCLDNESAEWWFNHGSFPNIFFRQTATFCSAYCHLRAATLYKDLLWPLKVVKFGVILGVVSLLVLLYLWQF